MYVGNETRWMNDPSSFRYSTLSGVDCDAFSYSTIPFFLKICEVYTVLIFLLVSFWIFFHSSINPSFHKYPDSSLISRFHQSPFITTTNIDIFRAKRNPQCNRSHS